MLDTAKTAASPCSCRQASRLYFACGCDACWFCCLPPNTHAHTHAHTHTRTRTRTQHMPPRTRSLCPARWLWQASTSGARPPSASSAASTSTTRWCDLGLTPCSPSTRGIPPSHRTMASCCSRVHFPAACVCLEPAMPHACLPFQPSGRREAPCLSPHLTTHLSTPAPPHTHVHIHAHMRVAVVRSNRMGVVRWTTAC